MVPFFLYSNSMIFLIVSLLLTIGFIDYGFSLKAKHKDTGFIICMIVSAFPGFWFLHSMSIWFHDSIERRNSDNMTKAIGLHEIIGIIIWWRLIEGMSDNIQSLAVTGTVYGVMISVGLIIIIISIVCKRHHAELFTVKQPDKGKQLFRSPEHKQSMQSTVSSMITMRMMSTWI